jgi:predicted acyltransferase
MGAIQNTPEVFRSSPSVVAGEPKSRLVSLDAFRGLTMALMVMVNNAGSDAIYHQFRHSPWNGWTIADTIFPSFVWIMGVALTLSLGKRLQSGMPPFQLYQQIFRRTVLLYVLGLIVYVAPAFDLSTQRILGVLQRIAICYLIASVIYLHTSIRGQIVWAVGFLVAYWLMMTLIPVPDFGAGNLTVDGNFAHYVDRIVLGRHNYRWTKTWDPEGIVSTIPTISTVLLGILAGHVMALKRSLAERCVWLSVMGSSLLFAGLVCNTWLPINKQLWTSSFVLFMAGLDAIVFSGLAWLIDACGYRRWATPAVVFGMNAIPIYMLSEILAEVIGGVHVRSGPGALSVQDWIFHHAFLPVGSDSVAALLYAIAFTMLMYGVALWLYRRKWFLRV